MLYASHVTYAVEVDGSLERRPGQLPAAIRRAPVSCTIIDGTDQREAARLLRVLADALEHEASPAT
jgi:hypothetical protein